MLDTHRLTSMVLVALLVVGAAAVPGVAAAQPAPAPQSDAPTTPNVSTVPENNTTDTNKTDNATSPGALLSGVLGVQQAELGGTIEQASFGLRVAEAATPNATAEVVDEQLTEIRNRLEKLQERKQELKEARKNGTISNSTFKARMASLAAEVQTLKHLTNMTADVAADLPNETLRAQDVNVTAIQTLQQRAANLTGPEVAEIARSIAGPSIGTPGEGVPSPVNVSTIANGEPGPGDLPVGNQTETPGPNGNETIANGEPGPGDFPVGNQTETPGPNGNETTTNTTTTTRDGGSDGTTHDGTDTPTGGA